MPAARLDGPPGDASLDQVRLDGYGHAFTVGTDTLRVALDAAVLSPASAIGVDDDGRVLGLATFDEIRAAIARASQAEGERQGLASGQPHLGART